MRITDINIEQFATWRDLRLELPNTGMCVFYGPNEAGKSTLLKFIRGVLYGMPATGLHSRHATHQALEWSGSLAIEHDKRSCRVHRAGRIPGRGQVTISGSDDVGPPEERLKSWLSNVDQLLYEQIYALGLGELQELNTLQEGEVAARIYGLTLGPDGQRLIQSAKKVEAARQTLSQAAEPRGRIDQLLADRERVQQQLRDYDKRHKQHRELCRTRSQLSSDIAERQEHQKRLQGELRGHQYLQQAWSPWKRLREQRAELEKLPRIESFPERGLELLEEMEKSLKDLQLEHTRLCTESKGAKTQVRQLSLDRTLHTKAATVQGLLEWRPWINQIHQRISDHEKETVELSKSLDEKLSRMGPAWSARRLDLTDVSPAANLRLANLSRSYKAVLARHAALQRYCDRAEKAYEARQKAWHGRLKTLKISDLNAGLQQARSGWEELKLLGELRIRERNLQERMLTVDEQRERLEARLVLPGWVYFILGFFAFAGIALMILGAVSGWYAGANSSEIFTGRLVGAIFAFLGLSCTGLALSLRSHFERETHERMGLLDDDAYGQRNELAQLRDRIRRLRGTFGLKEDSNYRNLSESDAEILKHASARISELEQLQLRQQRQEQLAKRLEFRRRQLQEAELECETARQNWQALLAEFGFPTQMRIDEALDGWKQVTEARATWQQRDQLQRNIAHLRELTGQHNQKILDLNQELRQHRLDSQEVPKILHHWDDVITTYRGQHARRRELRGLARNLRRDALKLRPNLRSGAKRLTKVLVSGGATTPEDFKARAKAFARRQELLELIRLTQEELEQIGGHFSDLAIVEDDLQKFQAQKNSERITALTRELAALQQELQQACQKRGELNHEIQTLEEDRLGARLRREREQIDTQLQEALTQWTIQGIGGQILTRVRGNFERTCQPLTLADASRYLTRLTQGRYRNIWTPLGERDLHVDDDQQRTWNVGDLSRGTREQLFLSIRLALIQQLSRQGIQMPMVLDDVFVNFDEGRTNAALEVLEEFAQHGQQLLFFTCHRYLAEMFEQRGIPPVLLPASYDEVRSSQPERRAG